MSSLGRLGSGSALSYAQYQSLKKGMRAHAILNAFGRPADTLEREGKLRGLTYRCEDGNGKARELRMVFSAGERLQEWVLRLPDGSEPQPPRPKTADGPEREKAP